MATTDGLAIVTTQSNHVCPGPTPAMSLIPPTPPAGPVPSPFAYIALSSSGTHTEDRLTVGGAPVLVVGSAMDIQVPGNLPSQPTGGDVVTHAVCQKCGVFTGSSKLLVGGKGVARTTDKARLNMPYERGMVAQTIGTLVSVDVIRAAANPAAFAARDLAILDPVSVASGAVLDMNVDLAIPGLIPIELRRVYSSARVAEHTPFGRGGFTHAYHQWIAIEGDELRLRDADGSTVHVPAVKASETAIVRRLRLLVTRDARGGASVFSLETHLTRHFARVGSGRAMLVAIADACGNEVRLEYEAERLARIIDTARRTVAFTHDGDGHITRVDVFPPEVAGRAPAPVFTVRYAYDTAGQLAQATDPLGHAEHYAYDEQRRLVRKTIPSGLSFYYEYDPETGRCVRAWGDGGLHRGDIAYDLAAGITRLTGNPEPRTYAWDPHDFTILRESSSDGQSGRAFTYDADGLVVAETNAAGETFRFAYDEQGNLTHVSGPLGPIAELTYADGLLVRRAIGAELTTYEHDPRGQLLRVTYASGAFLSLTYDPRGRLAAVHGPSGLRAAFTYDEQHNVIEERTARGGLRRWGYDALGRPVAHTDALGNVTRRELDPLGRPTALRLPDGGALTFAYDALGRLVRRVDALGRVETVRYAGLASPIEVTLPDGAMWRLSYDLNERLQQIKNPKGEAFELRYDRNGELREMRAFDGRIARAERGRDGQLARVEQPDGTFRALRRNAAGMVLREETPHGAVKVEMQGEGVLAFIAEDPALPVSVLLEHDALGRVIVETQNGRSIRYAYDAQNRVVARHLPMGLVTRYAYDEEGQVVTVDHDGYRVTLQRDLAGAVVRRVFHAAGVEARRVFDPMMRPVRDWVGSEAGTLVDRLYAYDLGGALVERNDARWGASRYRYDEAGMLIEAASAKGREAFLYDAGHALSASGQRWEVGEGGLLLRTESATYTYDAGNRRAGERRQDGAETAYLWDCRGQLREVRLPDGTRVLLAYDPFGRRVRKEIHPPLPSLSGVEGAAEALGLAEAPQARVIEYLWDGLCLAAEIDSERGLRVFVSDPGTMTPLLQQEGGAVYAVVTDHLGMPTDLVGPRGELSWSARHSAFGVIEEEARPPGGPEVASPFRMLGQYHDAELGLCYVRYRYFDPKVARFLSPDPLEFMGGRNLFAFNGSPTTHVDPLGLACILLGHPAQDKAIRESLAEINPKPGEYLVVGHGLPHMMALQDAEGKWSALSPNQLIERIRLAGNYSGEGTIILNSCNTGRTPNGVAQQVSAAFPNAWVRAPSDMVWGLGVHIGPPKGIANSSTYVPNGERFDYDLERIGQWNRFYQGRPQEEWFPTDAKNRNQYNQYTTIPEDKKPPVPPVPPEPGENQSSTKPPTPPEPGEGENKSSTTKPPNTQPIPSRAPGELNNGLPFKRSDDAATPEPKPEDKKS